MNESNLKIETVENDFLENRYSLKIDKIKGDKMECFNAVVKAYSAVNFINFTSNYSELLPDFFDLVTITDLQEKKEFILKHHYKKMMVAELRWVFDKVLSFRKIELEPFLNKKIGSISEVTDYEQLFYKMLFNYGEKIGGYIALANMNPLEVVKMGAYFGELEEQKQNLIEEKTKK
jgi:hypothetical protein